MRFSLLEPKKVIWQGKTEQVLLPTLEGQICVLDFHQPFVARLQKGEIVFSGLRFLVKDGIASMRSNILNVFVQT